VSFKALLISPTLRSRVIATTWRTSALVGCLGVFYCVILVIAPDTLPALIGREGMVWTPINSPMYRFGDNYYYGAWVAELIRNGIPPYSPSAAEYAGRPILETLRWLPLAVAALPGLFISDYRVVYVVDYAFTAAALFGVPYILAWRLLRSSWGGLIAGTVVLFGTGQWWSALPVAPGFGGPPSVTGWIVATANSFFHQSFTTFFNIFEYEALQGSFRYMNNSISAPILLVYMYACFTVYRSERPAIGPAVVIATLSPLLAFSYPSHTMIAYGLLGGFAGLALLRGHIRSATVLAAVAVLTILLLVSFGYVGYVRRVFAESELWNNIFQSDSITLIERPLGSMTLLVLVNKFTITFWIALALSWRSRDLRDLVLLVGMVASGLACTGLFNMPQLWDRFLGRGIDHLWVTCLMLSLVSGYVQLVRAMRRTPRSMRASQFAAGAILVAILAIPAKGFGGYALASCCNLTRFMPDSRWQALAWIDRNVPPGSSVAALNWDDITFVPLYTHAKLLVDNTIVGGRSPVAELERYVALWKVLGYDRALLERRLTATVQSAMRRLSSSYARLRNPPLVDEETYASGQIAEAILYWPYVKTVGGIAIADSSQTTTSAFVAATMAKYDAINPAVAVHDFDIRYVMVSGAERALSANFAVPATLVYENPTHRIYALYR
jgi:hypothetical protein